MANYDTLIPFTRYWLYGEKVQDTILTGDDCDTGGNEIKGWFPRRCVASKLQHRPTCKNFNKPVQSQDPKKSDSSKSLSNGATTSAEKNKKKK